MTAACISNGTTQGVVLHLAFELGWTHWKLAFTMGHGQKPRQRTIRARDLAALEQEIAKAKKRFQLGDAAPVFSCYEAGRDGFWLHRYLTARGIANVIVDSASIEVNRRKRRVKSDKLDANKLVNMLIRYHAGERKVWSVVRVPSVADEDQRQLHRELQELKDDRTRHINRIKGLLASQGLALEVVDALLPELVGGGTLVGWHALGADLQGRLVREHERWQFVHRQVLDLIKERRRRILCDATAHGGTWCAGCWGWRASASTGPGCWCTSSLPGGSYKTASKRVRLVGLTGTPYQSGGSAREQGISKAGSKRMRKMLVELAWCWLRWQPESALSQWYGRRFGTGKGAARKIGIVALARKLFIALWKYLERGEIPAGAKLVDWRSKLSKHKVKKPAA